jgi:hypothetical protein
MNYLGEFFRPLRPLRLCGRYSEFRLRLCRARHFVVQSSPRALREIFRVRGESYET